MGLSQSDIRRIAVFVGKVTKAQNAEAIVAETFQVLKAIAKTERLRIVYSPFPGRWMEWKTEPDELEVWPREEWPAPEKKTATVFFDPENQLSGFISAGHPDAKVRSTLDVLVPQVWSALLLRSAVDRAQKASLSETELVRATLRGRDEERRHIARELHDDLGQSLVSLNLSLKWAENHARNDGKVADVVQELSNVRESVAVMLDKVRDLSRTLYPQVLDTLGLVAAVRELIHQLSRISEMKVECRTQGKPRALGKDTEVALYRCCQEAINNAIRHSEAANVSVCVSFGRKDLRVTVEDNGKGFDPRALYDSNSRMMSSGFWTIRQRMADIAAAFRVSTAEGQGTVVELIVPYSSRESNDNGKDKSTHRR
jgi:signal transduction histidine kinase